jgi:hypothetical protein
VPLSEVDIGPRKYSMARSRPAGELPDAHGDPADRVPVATAIVRGLTLVTVVVDSAGWLGLVTGVAVFPVCYGVARARRASDQAVLEQLTHELAQAIRVELALYA